MIRLADALVGVQRLAVDSAPVIYFVEAQPQYRESVSSTSLHEGP